MFNVNIKTCVTYKKVVILATKNFLAFQNESMSIGGFYNKLMDLTLPVLSFTQQSILRSIWNIQSPLGVMVDKNIMS